MNWEDLRIFVAIASAGTLSGAARQLSVDQATISRRLATLETDLGVRLINRLPRQAQLTPVGHTVLAQALEIEERAFAIKRLCLNAHTEARTKVTISAPPILARHFLAPNLLNLSQRMPHVQVSILSEPQFSSLSRLEADLAMRLAPGVNDSEVVKKVGQMAFALYAGPSYANLNHPDRWEFIGYTENPLAFDHKTWLYETIGARRVICEVADLSNQYEAACTGIGVAGLPCFLADHDPRLVKLSSPDPLLSLGVWLALHPDRRNDLTVRETSAAIQGLLGALRPASGRATP
jgi:DNA-binding transcriptional LysR family regulator